MESWFARDSFKRLIRRFRQQRVTEAAGRRDRPAVTPWLALFPP